jgi:hypothetical protein
VEPVDGIDIARQWHVPVGMRIVLFGKQFQLFVVGRVVGHQGELSTVMDHHGAVVELDDRGVATDVLECDVDGGVEPVRTHHRHVDTVHQCQGLGDAARLVQQVLQPHAGVQTGLGGVARTEIRRLEIQAVPWPDRPR